MLGMTSSNPSTKSPLNKDKGSSAAVNQSAKTKISDATRSSGSGSSSSAKQLRQLQSSMQSEIDEMIEDVVGGIQDDILSSNNNDGSSTCKQSRTIEQLPLPSPRNVFTAPNDLDDAMNPSPTLASSEHQIISLKMLDSDDPSSTLGPIIKPESSKRVSFSKRVKMKEVYRYISSSSPSQRPPKPPKNGNMSSNLSSSSTPSSTKRKRSDSSSSASLPSKSSSNHSHSSFSAAAATSSSRKESRSLGSMYFADSKAALASTSLSSNIKTRQQQPIDASAAATTSNNAASSAGVLNSSDGYLISSEGDQQSQQSQSLPKSENIGRPSVNTNSAAPLTASYSAPLRAWMKTNTSSASNRNSSTSKRRREIPVSIAFFWEKVRLYETGTENSKSINVKKSNISLTNDTIMISEKISTRETVDCDSSTFSANGSSKEEILQLFLYKNQVLTVQHAPSHPCYPYSFLKIMVKDGVEFLIAINGTAHPLVAALRSMGLSTKILPHEAYARALALVETANAVANTGSGSSSKKMLSVASHIPSSSPSHPMFYRSAGSHPSPATFFGQQYDNFHTGSLPTQSLENAVSVSAIPFTATITATTLPPSVITIPSVLPVEPLSLMPRPFDNKVLYLWEQNHDSNQLKVIGLHHARITLVGQVLEIVDDACLYISIQVKNIEGMLHAHHSYIPPPDTTAPLDSVPLSYSLVKITTMSESIVEVNDGMKSKSERSNRQLIDYLVGVEGSMLPLLKKLGMLGVSCLSFGKEESDKMKALVRERRDCESPSKIVGGILKK